MHAMAYAQACHAMQTFVSRAGLPLAGHARPGMLDSAADIDLSLPITATYLRRLRGPPPGPPTIHIKVSVYLLHTSLLWHN